MSIDYEKSFKKLVKQIRLEMKWASEAVEEHPDNTFDLRKKLGLSRALTDKEYLESCNLNRYYRGMKCAYGSIEELAEKLEKGEFEFGD